MGPGTRYDEEFKKTIVELYNTKSKTMTELKREYGLNKSTLYQWIKKYSPITLDNGETITNADVKKLQKQLFETQQELEILKKALAIFSKK